MAEAPQKSCGSSANVCKQLPRSCCRSSMSRRLLLWQNSCLLAEQCSSLSSLRHRLLAQPRRWQEEEAVRRMVALLARVARLTHKDRELAVPEALVQALQAHQAPLLRRRLRRRRRRALLARRLVEHCPVRPAHLLVGLWGRLAHLALRLRLLAMRQAMRIGSVAISPTCLSRRTGARRSDPRAPLVLPTTDRRRRIARQQRRSSSKASPSGHRCIISCT